MAAAGGYCVSHEIEAHSSACASNAACQDNELCFKEAPLPNPRITNDGGARHSVRGLTNFDGGLVGRVQSVLSASNVAGPNFTPELELTGSRLLTETENARPGSCIHARYSSQQIPADSACMLGLRAQLNYCICL